MRWPSDEEVRIRAYLLGNLDEQQREQVEERLLLDDDFADGIDAAQDQLIDDYAFNRLTKDERAKFETNFLIGDERRKKLLFAQTLERHVSREEARQAAQANLLSQWWKNLRLFVKAHKGWSTLAAATSVLLIFLIPSITRWIRQSDQTRLTQNRVSIEHQVAEINKRPLNAEIQALPARELTLQPTLLREDGAMPEVDFKGDIRLLSLRLILPQVSYASYRALVQTVEGTELFAVKDLKPELGAAELLLKIPSQFLPPGDYQIALNGIASDGRAEDVARYNFRVRR